MTSRRPLVIVNGLQQELPAGDSLSDPVLEAVTQIAGLSGTLLEVESNTKAGRVTLRYTDAGPVSEQCFAVGHHSIGASSNFSATTTFVPSDALFIGWFGTGLFVLRKLWVTLCTSAVSGTRAGIGNMYLRDLNPLLGAPSSNLWCLPPQSVVGNNLNTGSANVQNFHSLRQRQPSPQAIMAIPTSATAPVGSMNWTGSAPPSSQADAQLEFGVKSQVGVDLPPTMLIDTAAGQQPIVLEPSQGLVLGLAYPVAVTSQVVQFSINAVWDEWFPIPQVML